MSKENKEYSGINIYRVDNKTIFYDVVRRKGFYLNNANLNKYDLYESLLPFCFISGYAVYRTMGCNYHFLVVSALITFVVIAVIFRLFTLYRCPIVGGFVPTKRSFKETCVQGLNIEKVMFILGVTLALAFILVYDIFTRDFSINNIIGNAVIATLSFIASIYCLIILISKNKVENK